MSFYIITFCKGVHEFKKKSYGQECVGVWVCACDRIEKNFVCVASEEVRLHEKRTFTTTTTNTTTTATTAPFVILSSTWYKAKNRSIT